MISFCGSFSRRNGSSGGEPIVTLPGGSTVISGQLRHSLNVWPGFGAPRRVPSVWASANADVSAMTVAAIKNERLTRM